MFQSLQQSPTAPEGTSTGGPAFAPGGGKVAQAVAQAVPGPSTDTAGGVADAPVAYHGYDSNETVPVDMCLIGCIFYMGEYLKADPCEDWIKVREPACVLLSLGRPVEASCILYWVLW